MLQIVVIDARPFNACIHSICLPQRLLLFIAETILFRSLNSNAAMADLPLIYHRFIDICSIHYSRSPPDICMKPRNPKCPLICILHHRIQYAAPIRTDIFVYRDTDIKVASTFSVWWWYPLAAITVLCASMGLLGWNDWARDGNQAKCRVN